MKTPAFGTFECAIIYNKYSIVSRKASLMPEKSFDNISKVVVIAGRT